MLGVACMHTSAPHQYQQGAHNVIERLTRISYNDFSPRFFQRMPRHPLHCEQTCYPLGHSLRRQQDNYVALPLASHVTYLELGFLLVSVDEGYVVEHEVEV